MDSGSYIATFNSTHHALKFEKVAKENDINIIMMPVPRNIAASCGLAVKFNEEYLERIVNLTRDEALDYSSIYAIKDSNGKKEYIKVDVYSH